MPEETPSPIHSDQNSLDHMAICRQAIGPLARQGLLRLVERDELLSVGCLAIIERAIQDEALAVIVARSAMIGAIRRNEVRQRGRVFPSARDSGDSAGDPLENVIYSGQRLAPDGKEFDMAGALGALTPQQYAVVVAQFWGKRSQAEIAAEMGVSQAAVSKICITAKKSLRAVVNGDSQAVTPIEGEILSRRRKTYAADPGGRGPKIGRK